MDKHTENKLKNVAAIVCRHYGINREDLDKNTRVHEIVLCRQVIWRIVRDIFGTAMPYADIGTIGNRDHATVIYGIKAISNYLETDGRFAMEYEKISRTVNSSVQPNLYKLKVYRKGRVTDKLREILTYQDAVNMRIGIRTIIKEFE